MAETAQKNGTFGLIAEFDDPDALLHAAKTTYGAGYRQVDAYSPFPVHGLAEAIGFHRNSVALFTLIGGILGACGGFALQVIGHAWHYPYLVAGRPFFSWPSFIVITFECMVLLASFTCGIAMILLNGLPRPHHPVMNAKNFDRATSDRFFLCIESDDPQYDPEKTRVFLLSLQPSPLEVSEVESS